MPGKQIYERSFAKLEDEYSVFFLKKQNIVLDFPVRGHIKDGKIIEIDKGPHKKTRLAITDKDGRIILETNAWSSHLRAILENLKGRGIKDFRWSPVMDDGTSDGDTDIKAVFRLKPEPHKTTGSPIPAIYLDTETTGLDPRYDEILQLSIINQDGETLWNKKYKPAHVESWEEAARINHIHEADVKDLYPIQTDMQQIQQIFDRAQKVYAWNAIFDLSFLAEAGLRTRRSKIIDSMREYARRYYNRDYYKLVNAASEIGFEYNAHDSLEDSKALRAVQVSLDHAPAAHSDNYLFPENDKVRMSHLRPTDVENVKKSYLKIDNLPEKSTPTQSEKNSYESHHKNIYSTIITVAILIGAIALITATKSWPVIIVVLIIIGFIFGKK